MLEAVHTLADACNGELRGDALSAQVASFLSFFQKTLEPHMKNEESHVYPLLDRYVPAGVGSAEAMVRDHETLRSLAALLGQVERRIAAGDEQAASEVSVLAGDMELLLREHIRKEDGVVNPLLERILKSVHA